MKRLGQIAWLLGILCHACTLDTVWMEQEETGYHPVFNEVMSNPSGGNLPAYEWIELYNPSDKPLLLSDYHFMYNGRRFSLPDLYFPSRQYIILTDVRYENEFQQFGNVIGISGWPQLNNTGATLTLEHQVGGVVDELTYSNRWYTTTRKRNGGWTLERINPSFVCNPRSNWAESESLQGGTPGQRNSVYQINHTPEINLISSHVESNVIELGFDSDLDRFIHIEKMDLSGQPIQSWKVEQEVLLIYLDAPYKKGLQQTLSIEGKYCRKYFKKQYDLFVNEEIMYNDIVINEILFHPKESGVDFVELYNRSGKIIDLAGWKIGNRALVGADKLFFPDHYCLITTDPLIVKKHYPSADLGFVIQLPSLPAYANQQGIVTLSYYDQLVDSLYYQASMHQPFLSQVKGVSLERVSADIGTNVLNNFTSASTYGEGATPGYINSKNRTIGIEKNKLFTPSKIFVMDMNSSSYSFYFVYEFMTENVMVNLTIYDEKGRIINRLIRHKNVGFTGRFVWDGTLENRTLVPSGTYLFQADIYTEKGDSESFKGSFLVVRKGL